MNTRIFTRFKINAATLIVGSLLTLSSGALISDTSYAVNVIKDNNSGYFEQATNQDIRRTDTVKNITNTMLYLLGLIAVIAIIIGGIKYVLANGDAGKVKSSKDIILYSVIGLIVAIMAWGIVNFVLDRF